MTTEWESLVTRLEVAVDGIGLASGKPAAVPAEDTSLPADLRDRLYNLKQDEQAEIADAIAAVKRKYSMQRDCLMNDHHHHHQADVPTIGRTRSISRGRLAAEEDSHVAMALNKLDFSAPLSFVVFGATGDLAKKKLYPALAALLQNKLVPEQGVNVKGTPAQRDNFFSKCSYFQGGYDKPEDFARLHETLLAYEGARPGNRVFFLSVPPTIFGVVCELLKKHCQSKTGYNHLIIEKPFGRDSESFAELNAITSQHYQESQLFRIDHYLGKEVVLNLATLRFGNQILEPLWNKEHIESVQITWKEDLGTGGRGGYFDGFGIIRDIMQNHLLQVFMFLTMEPPASLRAEDLAAQKVALLKAVTTLRADDTHLGQFTGQTFTRFDKKVYEPGYLEDPTVPEGSVCPTFAMLHLKVDNDRWKGVPFLMSAGKGLDERMCEVRVTFKPQAFNQMVKTATTENNQLVMRIQPDEAIFIKMLVKRPGLEYEAVPGVLDLSYKTAFPDAYKGDAYERMFLNAAKGDNSLFVGTGELVEAWRIFTPLLHDLDKRKPAPVPYKFGSRGPAGLDEFAKNRGVVLTESWAEFLYHNSADIDKLKATFESLARCSIGSHDCSIDRSGIVELAKQFRDGRPPSDAFVDQILGALDVDKSGEVTWEEFHNGAIQLLGGDAQRATIDDHTANWVTAAHPGAL